MSYYIGVDGGGSKTLAVLIDQSGNILAETTMPSANIRNDPILAINSITAAIDEIIRVNHLVESKVKIGIGVAGYSLEKPRRLLLESLEQKYTNYKLTSDCHLACLAAHNGQAGGIVICGTGVVGYVISQDDKSARKFGGWGFPCVDLGGAAWIGLQLCRKICLALDDIVPWTSWLAEMYKVKFNADSAKLVEWISGANPSDFATLVKSYVILEPRVLSDPHVVKILHSGSLHLEDLITSIVRNYPSVPVQLSGGLADLYIPFIHKNFPNVALTNQNLAYGGYWLWDE